MPVHKDKKIAFIHIPRTGGVSICKSFDFLVDGGHSYYDYYDENYPDYFKFAVIRNPVDRFISAYFYMQKFDKMYPHKARYYKVYKDGIEVVATQFRTLLLRKQVDFIYNNGNLMVDKIFKSIDEAYIYLKKEFEFKDVKLFHENFTSHNNFILSDKVRNMILEHYKEDVELWNTM